MPAYGMYFKAFVSLVMLLCLNLESVISKESDPCSIDDKPGTCRGFSSCKEKLKITGRSIQICGYTAREALVCCPNEGSLSRRFDDSSERISVRKCNEYRGLSYNEVVIGSMLPFAAVRVVDVPKCDSIIQLIVGGNVTKPGEFPHMAAIGWRHGDEKSFNCGGSLISERFVLTAAHCYMDLNGAFPSFVRLGDQNLVRTDDGARHRDIDIKDFVRHEEFKFSRGRYNDIALIKLKKAVLFTEFIRPACLYDQQEVTTKQAVATGFGLTENHGDKSDTLLKVSLDIFDNQVCHEGYAGNKLLRKGMQDSQLCVGSHDGKRDTCQGDSGGPLQITRQEARCMFFVLGITSFGQSCGSTMPAVYTRVASYLDWIEGKVWA